MTKHASTSASSSPDYRVAPQKRPQDAHPELLNQALKAWHDLDDLRRKARRSTLFAFGDQWREAVSFTDASGIPRRSVSEAEFIAQQGLTPLKNNLIGPILKNIEGQFRNQSLAIKCTLTDPHPDAPHLEQLASRALNNALADNLTAQLDPLALFNLLLTGFTAQRIDYGFNPATQASAPWIHNCNPHRIFFNRDFTDPRGFDFNLIGEFFDLPLHTLLRTFAHSPAQRKRLTDIYSPSSLRDTNPASPLTTPSASPASSASRVFLLWTTNPLPSHVDAGDAAWYYYFLSPQGHILDHGPSPFPHRSHNYTLSFYPLINGQTSTFVEHLIDAQKTLNRTLTQVNARLVASLKGLKIYDEQLFPGIDPQTLADLASRTDGLLPATAIPGRALKDSFIQLDANVSLDNDFQLIQSQLQTLNDISGVSTSLLGKAPDAGTSASLYAQESRNAAFNIKGLLDSFNAFTLNRSAKLLSLLPLPSPSGSESVPSRPSLSLSFVNNP